MWSADKRTPVRCAKKENLHTARIGDSVVVRYLPDDPGVHRLVTDSAGRYEVVSHARGRSRSGR